MLRCTQVLPSRAAYRLRPSTATPWSIPAITPDTATSRAILPWRFRLNRNGALSFVWTRFLDGEPLSTSRRRNTG